jgi:hypothetical protein
MLTAPAWIDDPTTKITTAIIIFIFRPKRSATGPLTRDPNQAAIHDQHPLHFAKDRDGTKLTQQNRRHPPPFEPCISVDLRELGAEGLHGQYTRDDALVIAKEEAAE